ncbi:hypothetical protein C8R44DRAFT_894287 [Mycena epipterygia]|nr:hypothetical protein C8R44DRAFT_894277 [Mycena epipterygia]KAJ7084146.1 hypothetical protein C8R44DRAFT_894287 [Mycena epipterygia]
MSARPKPTPSLAIKSESSGTFNFMPPSHNDIKGLPAFIAKTWASKYLPTVYRASNRVQDPMAFATIGSDVDRLGGETVPVLQQVLSDVYPQSKWTIEWGDAICAKAISRLGERRSMMGKTGLRVVDEAFERPKYYGSLDGPEPGVRLHKIVHADAEYALRFNGPALFRLPTPESCTVGPRHLDYIKPDGFLKSAVFILTVKSYIKGQEYTIIPITKDDGTTCADISILSVGALAMGAASVERGYKLHSTGERATNEVLDFSSANFGTEAAGYMENLRNFTPSCWKAVLKSCGGTIRENVATAAPATPVANTLNGLREHMYIRSSP